MADPPGPPVGGRFGAGTSGTAGAGTGAAAPAPAAILFNFKPGHFDELHKPEDFSDWRIRTGSTIASLVGANELADDGMKIGQYQEKILMLLVSKVKERDGFKVLQTILNTAPASQAASTRGYQAWKALEEFYLSEGAARLDKLNTEFRRKQKKGEKSATFITDIYNTASEIRKNGETLDDHTIKRQLFAGLHREYSAYVVTLKVDQTGKPLLDFIRELKRLCESYENATQEEEHASQGNGGPSNMAFFSAADAYGYQTPPQSQSGPAHADATHFLRNYLQSGLLNATTENAIHHALAAVQLQEQDDGPTCYACGKSGHIASYCPERQRMYNGPGSYGNYAGGRGFRGGYRGRGDRFGGRGRFGGRNPYHQVPRPGAGMSNFPVAPDLSGSHAIRPEATASANTINSADAAAANAHSAHLTFAQPQWDEDYYYQNGHYDYDPSYNDFALISLTCEGGDDSPAPGPIVFHDDIVYFHQCPIPDDICDDTCDFYQRHIPDDISQTATVTATATVMTLSLASTLTTTETPRTHLKIKPPLTSPSSQCLLPKTMTMWLQVLSSSYLLIFRLTFWLRNTIRITTLTAMTQRMLNTLSSR